MSQIVVEGAVKVAAAAFRRGANLHRAGAMLRRVIACLDLNFLDHVRICGDDGSVVRADVDHARAVDRDVVLFTT